MARFILIGLLLTTTFCVIPVSTKAQGETTSAILGQVNDPTHAAVPGATVTITNQEIALGRIAHESTLRALKLTLAKFPFAHGARHPPTAAGVSLFDSYHCSRYNTNTGVLTEAMFRQVFASVRAELDRLDVQAPVMG